MSYIIDSFNESNYKFDFVERFKISWGLAYPKKTDPLAFFLLNGTRIKESGYILAWTYFTNTHDDEYKLDYCETYAAIWREKFDEISGRVYERVGATKMEDRGFSTHIIYTGNKPIRVLQGDMLGLYMENYDDCKANMVQYIFQGKPQLYYPNILDDENKHPSVLNESDMKVMPITVDFIAHVAGM